MSQTGPSHESSLLLTLEEISRLVSHARDPAETLNSIVRLIQGRIGTDVCSAYLLEHDRGDLVLGATVGLDPASVGRVRMRTDEGLTGMVVERMAPVMVDEASRHPRFKHFPETGEDPYRSFLGVPLIEAGTVQGVLVVQTAEPRTFSPSEVRMLVTVAAQLAPLVGEARLLEQVAAAARAPEPSDTVAEPEGPGPPSTLTGVMLSPGAGTGRAYFVNSADPATPMADAPAADPAAETPRLNRAMEAARDEISRLGRRIAALVGEDHGAILQAQLMILQDRSIERDLAERIKAGSTAEAALTSTLEKYVAVFEKMSNPYFRERAFDIKDVFRRILWHLRPGNVDADAQGDRVVLVSREASVLDLFTVDLDRLAGVAVENGGPQSHAAILARSLGVPMVGRLNGLLGRVQAGQFLRVDGSNGQVDLAPPAGAEAIAEETADAEASADVDPAPGLPRVFANVNLLSEVDRALSRRASGVGLFRTEFLLLARRTMPSEEEQVGIYRKLLTALGGRPATIRTFDLRPDKLAQFAHLAAASAYPLDWRLVLDSPPLQAMFKDQVRAILRASSAGPARLLVPLVTRTGLLDLAVETVRQAREELRAEGLEPGESVPLGIMIEAAAAVPMVASWADRVDFFALGTNDLTASAMGVDRDDPVGARPDDLFHPGLLRLLHDAIDAARGAGKSITVCGEMAADPAAAVALASFGVDALSVAVDHLGPTRRALSAWTPEALAELAPRLASARSAAEAREALNQPPGGSP